jgi:hypothetical protein
MAPNVPKAPATIHKSAAAELASNIGAAICLAATHNILEIGYSTSYLYPATQLSVGHASRLVTRAKHFQLVFVPLHSHQCTFGKQDN